MTALIVLALAAGLLIWFYNALVRLRVLVRNAWSDIDVQLKRRHDLIPNLVETVKGYAGHEAGTFERVVEARRQAVSVRDAAPAERAQAEAAISRSLRQLFALAEAYPELRASDSFRDLHRSLEESESGLEGARRYYNAAVRDLNTRIQTFPSNLVAGWFRFHEEEFFEAADEERAVPKVAF